MSDTIITVNDLFTIDLYVDLYKHILNNKHYTYVQLVNYVYELIKSEVRLAEKPLQNDKHHKTFAEYLIEDIEYGTITSTDDYESTLWYTICRMLFIESIAYYGDVHTVSITNVNYNGSLYSEFMFESLYIVGNETRPHINCKGIKTKTFVISIDYTRDYSYVTKRYTKRSAVKRAIVRNICTCKDKYKDYDECEDDCEDCDE